MSKSIGLYIHIPFCKSKCFYCDFNSYAQKENSYERYFDALNREILFRAEKAKDYRVGSIFIGGGTPSLVDSEYIYKILKTCRQSFDIAENSEISIESNPGTLSLDNLKSYKESGVNRLSIGLQAWQNDILTELGRIHTREDFLRNIEYAKTTGFVNINVDLIFGLPKQTYDNWVETLNNVLSLNIQHLSCYSLKIEDDTVLGKNLKSGLIIPPDEELDRRMYKFAIEKTKEYGLSQYEISNFAQHGFECKHNLLYWKAEEYIGVGAGAHSYFKDTRSNSKYGIDEYIKSILNKDETQENIQIIDKTESMSEYMILGLRLIDGVSAKEFNYRYNVDLFEVFGERIQKNIKKKLLEKENDRIRLTSYGLDVANEVFSDFI